MGINKFAFDVTSITGELYGVTGGERLITEVETRIFGSISFEDGTRCDQIYISRCARSIAEVPVYYVSEIVESQQARSWPRLWPWPAFETAAADAPTRVRRLHVTVSRICSSRCVRVICAERCGLPRVSKLRWFRRRQAIYYWQVLIPFFFYYSTSCNLRMI